MVILMLRSLLRLLITNLLVFIGLVLFLEGLASVVLIFNRLWKTVPLAERLYTRYDAELGWNNIPNVVVRDLFGPGIDVVINAQGLRHYEEFSLAQPSGKMRLVCIGDSYTFGYGVREEEGWCARLGAIEPGFEMVNMGQGGYGVDQAYLWYKRDGGALRHRFTLLGVVAVDLDRMMVSDFLGYAKPVLALDEGRLVVRNVPVPQRAYLMPWTTQLYQSHFQELRTLTLLRQWLPSQNSAQPLAIEANQQKVVLEKLIEDLAHVSRERGSQLVIVYLPSAPDYWPDPRTERKRDAFRKAAEKYTVPFLDLVPEFRRVPFDSVRDLFINKSATSHPGAEGHYSIRGNWYVAQLVYKGLLAHAGIASELAR
jgi:hypothetical protein